MKKEKNYYEIYLSIFLFISYILFIIINDYMYVILKPSSSLCSYLISSVIMIILYLILKRKIKIKKDNFNKTDVIFLLVIFGIFFLRMAFPDSAYDTLNYHLYVQENAFANNTTYNFFPARWINTFSFPLADRMHYFFRLILGYRLGMICNIFCLLVVFYQLKRILKNYIKNDIIISILPIIIILTEQIMSNMITYYVDLFVIPILLEIIIILLKYNNETSNAQHYFVLFLSGIAVALKVSNLIFLIPLAIAYIFKFRKSINYKTFLIGVPIAIFPILIYILNNYIQTGNPVFPFYNKIFKSEYLDNINWIEEFYGPKTFVEQLLWPVYTLTSTRRTFDTNIYYGRICFGFIAAIICVITGVFFKIKKDKKFDFTFWISILFLILAFVWANNMMGYIRYALILEILAGIICVLYIYKNYKFKVGYLISLGIIVTLIYTFGNTVSDLYKTCTELSWRYPRNLNQINYQENLKYLFSGNWDYSNLTYDIDCLGITDYNSGYASIITDKIPIIGISEGYSNNYGKKKFEEEISKCKNVYTITTSKTYDRTLDYMSKFGFEYVGDERYGKAEFLNIEDDLILFQIKKKEVK